MLPSVYNGKNKTFWFYYVGRQQVELPQTVHGNRSHRRPASGRFFESAGPQPANIRFYDPATTAPPPAAADPPAVSEQRHSQPTASILSALNLVNFYPLPNQPGTC